MNTTINKQFVTETLQQLVRINSVNPMLVDGAPGEKEIAHFLADCLQAIGINPEVEEIEPGRFNVAGLIKGQGGGPSLMLNAHTDTVGTEGMKDPFSAKIVDGKLYGRGAQDMKGSIAAMLAAAKVIKEQNIRLKGDLLLAFVADEEYASIGTERLVENYRTDAAIVTEPSGLDICLAHKGFGLFEWTTTGKAAHGSSPQDGIDANRHMGLVMGELDGLIQKLDSANPHPLLGTPSMHIPLIQGGSEAFTYAASCTMQAERRTLPGETLETIMGEFNAIIETLSAAHPGFQASVKPLLWREPFEINRERPVVRTLFDSVEEVTGQAPLTIGHSWWEDSAILGKAGIDTVIIGPKGSGMHSSEEWVDLQSVALLAEILLKQSIRFCGLFS